MNAPWQPPAGDRPVVAASPTTGILIDRVRKVYPARKSSAEVVALDDISLSVPKGAILGVIGRSGAGKSTLIRLRRRLKCSSTMPIELPLKLFGQRFNR